MPTGISVASPGTLNEGQTFNLHVTFSPPGMYMVSGTVNWGTSPTMNGSSFSGMTMFDGTLWLPQTYYDDGPSPGNGTASDVMTITVNETFANLVGSTTATVSNLAPTGLNTQGQTTFALTNTPLLGGPWWRVTGELREAFPMATDRIDVTINWGDGTPNTLLDDLVSPAMISQDHRFAPTGSTHTITITATDDDTGSYVWSKALEMYLLDLDNDAGGNGEIDAYDEEIEDYPPGAEIYINNDDDDDDGIADDVDVGPISGENNLARLNLAFSPANRSDVNYYNGWHVVLSAPASGKLWTSADKSGSPLTFTQTVAGLGKHWIVGQDTIPTSLYYEATQAGQISLSLSLWNPGWVVADSDTIIFTALAEPAVDLDIYNGQFDTRVLPDVGDKEVTVGAFTVANLNDTDGDGYTPGEIVDFVPDKDDLNGVIDNGDDKGGDEVDLMRLILWRPRAYDGTTPVVLRKVSGAVRFWNESTKVTELSLGSGGTLSFTSWPQASKEIWVEATAVSGALRDIELRLEYGAHSDTVKATAVWAELEAVEHDLKSYAQLFAAGGPWANAPAEFKSAILPYGGSGVRPFDGTTVTDPKEKEVVGIANVILFKWKLLPLGIEDAPGAFGADAVLSDATRRGDSKAWIWTMGQGPNDSPTEALPPLPTQNEKPNDDGVEYDEFDNPYDDDRLYIYDSPGWRSKTFGLGGDTRRVVRTNFVEFVRFSFQHGERLEGNEVLGSRGSDLLPWHERRDVKMGALTLERNPPDLDQNNPVENNHNDIGLGHLTSQELNTPPT